LALMIPGPPLNVNVNDDLRCRLELSPPMPITSCGL
jgi:hypothetical protein